MSTEIVDATFGTAAAGERALHAEVAGWAASEGRAEAIRWYQGLTGCSAYRAAEMADLGRAAEYHEERKRQADAEARRDALEAGAWMAERRTREQYARMGMTPPGSPWEVARHYGSLMGDEPARDASAPVGSIANPAQFVMASDGYLADIGTPGQADIGTPGQARRSLGQAADDALIARAKAMQADGFMLVEISRAKSRRARREMARAQHPAVSAARTPSGTGWPEISR